MLRPALLTLDLRVQRFALRWVCPAWAIDETLRAIALLLPWIAWFARHAAIRPRVARRSEGWLRALFAGPPGPAPWFTLHDALRGEAIPWHPPVGEPIVSLEFGRDVRIHLSTR